MPGHPFQRGNNKAAKLTGEQVIEIRERYATERGLSQPMLAREFGVSVNTIAKVVNGTSWAHLLHGAEPQVFRPPLTGRAPPTPDEQTLKDRMLKKLDEVEQTKNERRAAAPSLYSDPSPTEAEDRAAGQGGLGKLEQVLKKLPDPQPKVSDELDKLEKGD